MAIIAWQAIVGAIALAGLSVSLHGLSGFREKAEFAWGALGLKPALAVFGFYILQVVRRYTEGQSGANVTFILGLAPAIVLVAWAGPSVWRKLSERRMPDAGIFVNAAGVAAGILGTAAILANWERPSSLSPFAFFPAEELLLVGAAACWAAFLIFMRERARKLDAISAAAVVLGGAGFMLAVAALVSDGPAAFVLQRESLRLVVILGVGGAAAGCYGWIAMAKVGATPIEEASTVILAPALATLLIFVDQAQGLTGPNPMVEQPVYMGCAVSVLGVVAVWAARWWAREGAETAVGPREPRPASGENTGSAVLGFLAGGAAGVAVAAAAWGLLLPVRTSSIAGKLTDETPFAARWITQAYEAVGAWLVLIAALVVAFLVWQAITGRLDWPRLGAGAGFVIAMLAAGPVVSDSLFVAWRSWIPADIQHAIGTQYVDLTFKRLADPMFTVVDTACGIALALLIVKMLWKRHQAS